MKWNFVVLGWAQPSPLAPLLSCLAWSSWALRVYVECNPSDLTGNDCVWPLWAAQEGNPGRGKLLLCKKWNDAHFKFEPEVKFECWEHAQSIQNYGDQQASWHCNYCECLHDTSTFLLSSQANWPPIASTFFVYSSRCWLVGIQRRRKEMWVHPRLMPCFRFGQLSAWLEGYRMQPRTPRMWSLTQIQMKGDTQWQSSETRHVKWGASWNIWMNLITMVHLQFYQLLYL